MTSIRKSNCKRWDVRPVADINDLDYGDYVRVNHATYFVLNNDWETRAAGLIPIDLLAQYANDEDTLSEHEVYVPARQIEKIPPVKADESVLRSLFRLEIMPWQLVEQGRYPFGSVTGKFQVTEDDILTFIQNLLKNPNNVLIETWQENFSGSGMNMHAAYPKLTEPGFNFSFLCQRVLDVMDWIDPAYDDWRYIGTLAEDYLKSKGKPLKEITIPDDFKGDILSDIEEYAKNNSVTEEMREYYVTTLEELCLTGDQNELKRKGYAYYGGNGVVRCDWKKSEEALLKLFELERDPYVANSLGYIYYSDRLGSPDYEKAFYYFDYAAGDGVVEATYKLSDMYRKGHGTEKNPEYAWKLLMQLYEWCNKKKKDKGKYPDIMLRIGYCYRDGDGVERDIDKARECFYEAKEGIELRIKKHKGFGDEVVLRNVLKAIDGLNTIR